MKHGRTKQRRDRIAQFERCFETILEHHTDPRDAWRWLAAHIGSLRHDVDELRRENRRLRRQESP